MIKLTEIIACNMKKIIETTVVTHPLMSHFIQESLVYVPLHCQDELHEKIKQFEKLGNHPNREIMETIPFIFHV